MAQNFPLAGLLRLRQLNQDQAAGKLATANARLAQTRENRDRAASALEGTGSDVGDSISLYAVAAARASARSMLSDLEALDALHRQEQDSAQTEYREARAKTVGLEKLENRHATAAEAEAISAEQKVLDELAAAGWERRRGSAQP